MFFRFIVLYSIMGFFVNCLQNEERLVYIWDRLEVEDFFCYSILLEFGYYWVYWYVYVLVFFEI